jgi:ubiquinone/menaquinone biosynthesis C-methylase UbiE
MNKNIYYAFNRMRSLNYFVEYGFMRGIARTLQTVLREPNPKRNEKLPKLDLLNQGMHKLFLKDAENIEIGIYPPQVLKTESLISHANRIPHLIWDGIGIVLRRNQKVTRKFKGKAKDLNAKTPEYYQRNFHYQTDGYLSEKSAELYEHQVEMLFAGTADAMRRLIIAPLKAHFKNSDGEGLHFLELAAGTGRATRFLKLAFPKAQITLLDLSGPYLKLAQNRLSKFDGLSFVEDQAEELPFREQMFDAVFSVFLFHEIPIEIRKKVIEESRRVLKTKGFLGAVDSIQLGDIPEIDSVLLNFPNEFHEPFYPNYIRNPLEELLGEGYQSEVGFLSKVVWKINP